MRSQRKYGCCRVKRDDYMRLEGMATEAAKSVWGLLRKLNDTATRHPTP